MEEYYGLRESLKGNQIGKQNHTYVIVIIITIIAIIIINKDINWQLISQQPQRSEDSQNGRKQLSDISPKSEAETERFLDKVWENLSLINPFWKKSTTGGISIRKKWF